MRHAVTGDGNADGETPCAWAECAQAQGVAVAESVTATTKLCAAAAAGTKLQGKYIRTQVRASMAAFPVSNGFK